MKKLLVILSIGVFVISLAYSEVLAQSKSFFGPPDANAMGTKPAPKSPPLPAAVNGQPSPDPAHKATFGPAIAVPWKRGGTYTMTDVQESLKTLGWWVSEAKTDSGQYYSPPKLELAAVDDEHWKVLKKDIHMQAAKKFGKGSFEIRENEKHTAQWKHKLFRGGIQGIRSAIIDVVPRSSSTR